MIWWTDGNFQTYSLTTKGRSREEGYNFTEQQHGAKKYHKVITLKKSIFLKFKFLVIWFSKSHYKDLVVKYNYQPTQILF